MSEQKHFGLNAADLAGIPPELLDAREKFVTEQAWIRYGKRSPSELSRDELFDILDDPMWPKGAGE